MTSQAGALLSSARRARQRTQWEIANAAGITSGYLSQLETGAARVPPAAAARLAPVLGLDAAELVRASRLRTVPADARRPAAGSVRSFKDIPAVCPCDWAMAFVGRRPAGWDLVTERPGCPCHGNGGAR